MIRRPETIGAFQFVVLARLRAVQLLAGCAPRLPGVHTAAVMAQMEVAGGQVTRSDDFEPDTADR